jgi:hypothetical protein
MESPAVHRLAAGVDELVISDDGGYDSTDWLWAPMLSPNKLGITLFDREHVPSARDTATRRAPNTTSSRLSSASSRSEPFATGADASEQLVDERLGDPTSKPPRKPGRKGHGRFSLSESKSDSSSIDSKGGKLVGAKPNTGGKGVAAARQTGKKLVKRKVPAKAAAPDWHHAHSFKDMIDHIESGGVMHDHAPEEVHQDRATRLVPHTHEISKDLAWHRRTSMVGQQSRIDQSGSTPSARSCPSPPHLAPPRLSLLPAVMPLPPFQAAMPRTAE